MLISNDSCWPWSWMGFCAAWATSGKLLFSAAAGIGWSVAPDLMA
ncbi:hypothetical protein SynBIOSE41_01450 [Synechococcus sp. BIOS-E4-1]|nr:hypothetical protein SynBIOSE41_01450 [Synechococcus sp. BIOS-E4-1]